MVRLFVATCRCYQLMKHVDVNVVYQLMCNQIDYERVKCPNGCKEKGFHRDGTYKRKLICYEKDRVVMHEVSIACVECTGCGQTHAALPAIVLPHSQFSVPFVIRMLYSYIVGCYASVEKMCQAYDVAISTFYRLLHRFMHDWKNMSKIIQNCSDKMEEVLRKLNRCTIIELDELLEKFYKVYHFEFMCSELAYQTS